MMFLKDLDFLIQKGANSATGCLFIFFFDKKKVSISVCDFCHKHTELIAFTAAGS